HTVGSGTCSHVVGMQGTACAAAGCYGEVFLAGLKALLLVGTCYRMLETGGVGGVSGDGNVYVLFPHDGNAFRNAVGAVAVYLRAKAVRVGFAEYFLYLIGVGIVLGLDISKSVDSGDDLSRVLSKSV